jgi:hypothetical protein
VKTAEDTAREQLLEISRELEAIRFRLLGVQASLPSSPAERDLLREDDEMDTPTEIRSAIDCLLMDRIDPALRELQATASAGPRGWEPRWFRYL